MYKTVTTNNVNELLLYKTELFYTTTINVLSGDGPARSETGRSLMCLKLHPALNDSCVHLFVAIVETTTMRGMDSMKVVYSNSMSVCGSYATREVAMILSK